MKRMMIATALVTTLGTAAFAATEAQIQEIETFGAGVNVSTMTDAELDLAYAIVSSNDSHSEKLAKLRSLAEPDEPASEPMLSEAQIVQLQQYAPDVDFSDITRAQAEAALALAFGGTSESEKATRVQNVLSDESMVETMATDIEASERQMIEFYAPDIDLDSVTEVELDAIVQVIHSGKPHGEITSEIETIVNG